MLSACRECFSRFEVWRVAVYVILIASIAFAVGSVRVNDARLDSLEGPPGPRGPAGQPGWKVESCAWVKVRSVRDGRVVLVGCGTRMVITLPRKPPTR